MDANKRETLVAIGYKIAPACGSCYYGDFKGASEFGVCANFTYEHGKHSESTRQLSINRHGVCGSYIQEDGYEDYLGLWKEFVS